MDARHGPNRFIKPADFQAMIETQPRRDRLITAFHIVALLVIYGLAGANDMEEAARLSMAGYVAAHHTVDVSVADGSECQ